MVSISGLCDKEFHILLGQFLAFVNEVGGLEAVRSGDKIIGLDSSPEVGHLNHQQFNYTIFDKTKIKK